MKYDFHFRSRRSNVISNHGMVAASQPLAALAGLDILRQGGTAADAAITMAATLNVVEPFSTGIGGDCFALYWDAKEKRVHALNASGPAAKRASIQEVLDEGYSDYPMWTGKSITVPGSVAGWEALLSRFGRMTLKEVLIPAISYAQNGYPVSEWIAKGWSLMPARLLRGPGLVEDDLPLYKRRTGPYQSSGSEFLLGDRAPRAGEIMRLPTLALTLRNVAEGGSAYIYQGDFAQALCSHVQAYGGWLEPDDFNQYKPEWNDPIFADYHGHRLYECPPNGQGLAAIMAVRIAEGFNLSEMSTIDRTHTLVECMRLGFTEAFAWVSDPLHEDIPYEQLFDNDYIEYRRQMIKQEKAMKHIQTGVMKNGEDTTYLSVVDTEGNACSFINSLFYGGGSGLVVPGTGVLLQNRGSGFSLDLSHPNALKGGKRPYHTIIPAMITKGDELYASFGVMGGYMQPQGHLQMLVNLIDLGHNPQQALDMPRFRLSVLGGGIGAEDPGGQLALEEGFTSEEVNELEARGHKISLLSGYNRIKFGGGQIILREPVSGVLTAGSEPRKDGCALGY